MAGWVTLSALLYLILLATSNCFSIIRTPLSKVNLLSIYPSHIIPTRKAELLYVPSPLSQRAFNHASSVFEDRHFISRLSDCGYPIHTFEMPPSEISSQSLQACVIDTLAHLNASQSPIVILATELSCLSVLQVIGRRNDHKANNSCQIQGLVMVDPPPLHSVQTEYGRQRILQKFAAPNKLTFPPPPAVDSISTTASTNSTPTTTAPTTPNTPNTPNTPTIPSVTEEELEYYDNLVRRQRTSGFQRSIMQVHLPWRRSKFSRYLHSLRRRNTGPFTHTEPKESHLSPAEQNERILIALESGILTTTMLMGGDVLAKADTVRGKLGRNGVLVIGTGMSTARKSADESVVSTITTDDTATGDAATGDTASNGADTVLDTYAYDEAALFCEADDWSPASLNETAAIFSAYPAQHIPPVAPDARINTKATGSSNMEDDWSQEDVHHNMEIARLVDIFVRNLAL